MYSATPARKSRNPLNPSFLEILATIASDTPAPSATSLMEVVSSKLSRLNTDSTTLTSSGVKDGSAIRILGPTAFGSVPGILRLILTSRPGVHRHPSHHTLRF